MIQRTILILALSFGLLSFSATAQQPIDEFDYPDIPEISLDGMNWEDLELSRNSNVSEAEPWMNKIDGRARVQQRKLEILHREAEDGRMDRRDSEIPTRMDVLIRVESAGARQKLEESGFRTVREYNDILVGNIPFENLNEIAQIEQVFYIESAPEAQHLHDQSIPDINADQVHAGQGGLEMPYTGEDVIVGVVDSGLDFTHPDFSTEDGTRIQYLREYRNPDEFTPEVIDWDSDDIDNNPDEITQIDGNLGGGHGTHVTGTAAGGGQVDASMAGVAPGSDIIAVNASRNPQSSRSFSFNDIIDGTEFIFERAAEMNKPAVVNLSVGAFAGPRDGSTLTEEVMNEITGPGRVVVSSSGNSGFLPTHVSEDFRANSRVLAPIVVDEQQGGETLSFEAWYDNGSISEFALIGLQRSGEQLEVIGSTEWVKPGDEIDDEIEVSLNGDVRGYIVADATVTNADINGNSQITAEIFTQDTDNIDLGNTKWVFVANTSIRGGRFDMWVNEGGFFYPNAFDIGRVDQLVGDNTKNITLPASASEVIAVGAHVTRDSFQPPGEDALFTVPVPTNPLNPQNTRAPQIGELAFFSSTGPLRTGEQGIDVTAPGYLLYSAKSSQLDENVGYNPQLVREGGDYIINNGTSMAAPHAAGAIALMLQINSDLTAADVRDVLETSSREDQQTGSVPNPEFGFGKLDALEAMNVLETGPARIAEQQELPEDVELTNYPNPFNPATTVEFTLPEAEDVSISVYNSIGQEVEQLVVDEQMDAGTHQLQLDGSNLSSGVYLLRFQAGNEQLTRQVTLIK